MIGHRHWILFGLLLIAACSPPPAAAEIQTERREFFDGRYIVILQTLGKANTAFDSNSQSSGNTIEREWVQIRWNVNNQAENTLVIDKGELTVNGKSHGAVTPGSEIKVDPEGKVTVKPLEKT